MNIKSIFKSYNFLGNKILNAIFDTPVNEKHAANKKYVDDIQTYDTPKALQFNDPVKFSWIKQVQNKTFKQIFDDLFFPVVPPIYVNPTFKTITIKPKDTFLTVAEKHLIFERGNFNLEVEFSFNPGDRLSNISTILTIEDFAGQIQTFNSDTTSDASGKITAIFSLTNNIKSMTLKKQYNGCAVKNDNYGNPSITPEYSQNYNLEFDLKELFEEQNVLSLPMLYHAGIYTEEETFDYQVLVPSNVELTANTGPIVDFVRSNTIYSKANGEPNVYLLLIPKNLFGRSEISVKILNSVHNINKKILIPTNPTIVETTLLDNTVPVDYYVGTIDFGDLPPTTKIDFIFTQIL